MNGLTPCEQLLFKELSKVPRRSIIGEGIRAALIKKDEKAFLRLQIELLHQAVAVPASLKEAIGAKRFDMLVNKL